MKKFKDIKKPFLFIGLFILAFLLRLYVSNMGFNHDYGSWKVVGSLVAQGKNVYLATSRYSYGPIWAIALGFFKQLSFLFFNSPFIYRFLIIFFLSLADIAITLFLFEYIGMWAILLFLFNPVSIYVSGFHNQFDNISIAIALYSLRFIEKHRMSLKGYIFLGFSLVVKHVFLFFPLWLLISAKNNKQRLLSLIPLLCFVISFLPFISSQQALINIWNHVFVNKRDSLYGFLPQSPLTVPLVILTIVLPFGFLFKKEKADKQGLHYLLVFVIALTNIGAQYLAIPLAAYALNPFIGLFYTACALQTVVFQSIKLERSLILAFHVSWLFFLSKYFKFFEKILNPVAIFLMLIIMFKSLPYTTTLGKSILTDERKNIWFMQVPYPSDKAFFTSGKKSDQPLVSGNIVKGRFTASQDNLGFLTIPFIVEDPSEGFLEKDYHVTAEIKEVGNSLRVFRETRGLSNGLTGEGILLGFPILVDSNQKQYEISVFTDVPKNIKYLKVDLTGQVQIRYFLTRNLLNSTKKIIQFTYYKINFFLLQQRNISFLLQIYSYLWILSVMILLLIKSLKKIRN